MDIGTTVGDRITFFREQAQWERKQLAAATRISANRIGKFESGTSKPYFWEMQLIAVHLKRSMDYFDTMQPLSITITVSAPAAPDRSRSAHGAADHQQGRGVGGAGKTARN